MSKYKTQLAALVTTLRAAHKSADRGYRAILFDFRNEWERQADTEKSEDAATTPDATPPTVE